MKSNVYVKKIREQIVELATSSNCSDYEDYQEAKEDYKYTIIITNLLLDLLIAEVRLFQARSM